MAGLVSLGMKSRSRDSISMEQTQEGVEFSNAKSDESRVDSSSCSENLTQIMLSERQPVVDNSHLSLADIFENRAKVLSAFIESEGVPSPILDTFHAILKAEEYRKIVSLIKTCAMKKDLKKIELYEYGRYFHQKQLSQLIPEQKKIFEKAYVVVKKIAVEKNMSISEVVYSLSLVAFKRDPVSFSEHVLKFKKMHRKVNKLFKQRGEKPIVLSDAFLAYRDCKKIFDQSKLVYSFSNRHLVMIPYEYQLKFSQSEKAYGIELDYCSLTEFPDFLLGPHLTGLELPGNLLNTLPDAFGNCHSLRKVNVSHTMITQLPQSLLRCPRIRFLSLRDTKVSQIPEALASMPEAKKWYKGDSKNQLIEIDFSGNPIQLNKAQKEILKKLASGGTEIVGLSFSKRVSIRKKMKDL